MAGGEEEDRGWDVWMASLTQWTWVWVSSGRWWGIGKPGVLQSMGSQRVRHNWTKTTLKLARVCIGKKTINKTKGLQSEWEKIFANEATNKGLIYKICKPLMEHSIKKHTKKTVKKWGEYLNTHSSKEDLQLVIKHIKRCSTLLITREMQLKTIMKYHLTSIRMAIIKKYTNNKCWRGCGEKGTLLYCYWKFKQI